MIEKDNIQELFSKAFENQTAPVRPDLWLGVQAKMAVAATSSVVATKGMSVLLKWIIGSAAAGTVAVVTTVALSGSDTKEKNNPIVSQETLIKPSIDVSSDQTSAPVPKINNKQTYVITDEIGINVGCDLEEHSFVGQESKIDGVAIVHPVPTTVHQDPLKIIPMPANTTPANTSSSDEQVASNTDEEPVNTVLEAKLTKFPNFFSPNGDNDNDTYHLEFVNESKIVSFQFQVFNQENKMVYESTDPNFVWNGDNIYTNERIKEGLYFCLVMIVDASGNKIADKQLIEVRTVR